MGSGRPALARHVLIVSFLLHFAACQMPAAAQSGDLQPRRGRGAAPPNARGNGPWATRILLATSTNGLDFERLHFVLTDQAGVPNVMVDPDGRARVYYVDFGNGNILACAIQQKTGSLTNWTFHHVQIHGAPRTPAPVDPAVVVLPDHRMRLYFMQARPRPAIYSAVSTNGVQFTEEAGVRFDGATPHGPPQFVFDPIVLRAENEWRLWCGPDGRYSGRSTNGLEFTSTGDLAVDGARFMPWSAVTLPGRGGYRLYGNFLGPGEWSGGISSIRSEDGGHWRREGGTRLSLDGSKYRLEAGIAPDNGCALLPDGRWLMAYVATIPVPRPKP